MIISEKQLFELFQVVHDAMNCPAIAENGKKFAKDLLTEIYNQQSPELKVISDLKKPENKDEKSKIIQSCKKNISQRLS